MWVQVGFAQLTSCFSVQHKTVYIYEFYSDNSIRLHLVSECCRYGLQADTSFQILLLYSQHGAEAFSGITM